MDEKQFWDLIEQSRENSSSCDEQGEKLVELLEELETEEIIGFAKQRFEISIKAYRWDLWAVAYIINGGCSEDGFAYFRAWLIGQGREFFEIVLNHPERAAERVIDGEDAECEAILYACSYAYERKMSQEIPDLDCYYPLEPTGEKWQQDDLEFLYPMLCQHFFDK